jgi:hypothetical protein
MSIMKSKKTPIRSTIVWGLIGGLVYIPLCSALSLMVFWPLGIQLSLWILLSGYAVLLSRWASRPLRSIGLPLLLLLLAAFLIESATVFLFSAIVMLSWIRSGTCFKRKPIVKGVWLFFLIQALYFVLFEYQSDSQTKIHVDPFEEAKMAAEKILCGGAFY